MAESKTDTAVEMGDPYSLPKILGLWVVTAQPMALLGWVGNRRWYLRDRTG